MPYPVLTYLLYFLPHRPEYFMPKMKRELLKMQDRFKLLVLDEVHKMFDRTMKFRECYSLKSLKEEFPSTPIMVLTATLSEQPLHVLCTEHFCKLVLLKNSVNKKNIKINVHSPHVNLVFCVRCMRIVAVLVQEYGRAGRNDNTSAGFY